MTRLPRAEKLPLATRKDIRDSWENRKADYEETLSEVLGQPWTIVVDPYVQGAFDRLREFVARNGDEAGHEINEICSAHILTIEYDDTNTVLYCGVKISAEGQLVILFSKNDLGTNAGDAVNGQYLIKALNDAPSPRSMSFIARTSIRDGYKDSIRKIQEKLKEMLKQDISLVPNFEANFEKLKSSSDAEDGWERNFRNAHLAYFDGLVMQLEYEKFGENDLLQDGLLEVMDKNAVHIRVVDQMKRSYNEAVLEDGILYLQTTPADFGVNTSQVASDIVNIL